MRVTSTQGSSNFEAHLEVSHFVRRLWLGHGLVLVKALQEPLDQYIQNF